MMNSRTHLRTLVAAAALLAAGLFPAAASRAKVAIEADSNWTEAPSPVLMQLKSDLRRTSVFTSLRNATTAQVLHRMQYWKRWDSTRSSPPSVGPEKFFMFDYDAGGLNNLRIGWEVAATIAFETGRTLVLPLPKGFYLIDWGPNYMKPPVDNHQSRMEDFINMDQLKIGGLKVMTAEEFANAQAEKELTEPEVLTLYRAAQDKARKIHGNSGVMCDLSQWRVEDKVVYANMLSYSDGRLFTCSTWWELGQVKLVDQGADYKPSLQALSELHGGFVWHPDVFEMASIIVQDLGLFNYTSLHARYGDFQFKSDKEDASKIIDTWFVSDLGKRIMQNTTGVYVSTDDTSGKVTRAFLARGIPAKSSLDYWDNADSPIAGLTDKLGKMRTFALKGPVEQVVCTFARLFIGSGHSTFTGYINQMRINADAPQTTLIYHTDTPTEATLAQVADAANKWKERGGAESWQTPSVEPDLLQLFGALQVADEGVAALVQVGAPEKLLGMSHVAIRPRSTAPTSQPLDEAPSTELLLRHAESLRSEGRRAPSQQPGDSQVKESRGLVGALWDARPWAAVLVAPALLWAATSPNTGPMAIIGCYVAASIGMNVLNKEAATTFKATFLLVIIQMVFASLVILLMEGHKMKCSQWKDLLRWSVVPLAFAGMLATSMWAMREASLSAILILKNFLPIISFGAEKALFDTPSSVTKSMVLSLLLTFFGTVLYGFADASVTSLGKLLVVVNCGFTMLDRLVQTYYLKLSPDFTISVPLCMLLNNTLGVVPMLVLALASGEVPEWRTTVSQATSSTWLWVVLSSGCGACLGYVGLRTQQLVSGTTVLVLQNFNKVLLLAMSAALLGESLLPLSWLGCAISIGSCCWYSALRLPAETKDSSARVRKP